MTSIHHLEHMADQLEYLINLEKLPIQFMDSVATIRHIVVPQVARAGKSNVSVANSNNVFLSGWVNTNPTPFNSPRSSHRPEFSRSGSGLHIPWAEAQVRLPGFREEVSFNFVYVLERE